MIFSIQDLLERIDQANILILKYQQQKRELTIFQYQTEDIKATINSIENSIQINKVEKLIFQTLLKKSSTDFIYTKLFEKYNELLLESYEFFEKMVSLELVSEKDYIDYCKDSLEERDTIKKLTLGNKLYVESI